MMARPAAEYAIRQMTKTVTMADGVDPGEVGIAGDGGEAQGAAQGRRVDDDDPDDLAHAEGGDGEVVAFET
jgi:hypothetical protein